jgi:hypothetical protein
LARALVASARGNSARDLAMYRVATVRYDFDSDKGVDCAFDFQNYVMANKVVATSVGNTSTKEDAPRKVTVRNKHVRRGATSKNRLEPADRAKYKATAPDTFADDQTTIASLRARGLSRRAADQAVRESKRK